MNLLSFHWNETEPLQSILSRGFERMFVNTTESGAPIAAFLWGRKGKALRARSRMHDIADRVEVGVLEFELVTLSEGDQGQEVDVPASFAGKIIVQKLVIDVSGFSIESGLILMDLEGKQITILAGETPHTLAISLPSKLITFKPEYPLDRYRYVAMN